jgi:hypothetical protein
MDRILHANSLRRSGRHAAAAGGGERDQEVVNVPVSRSRTAKCQALTARASPDPASAPRFSPREDRAATIAARDDPLHADKLEVAIQSSPVVKSLSALVHEQAQILHSLEEFREASTALFSALPSESSDSHPSQADGSASSESGVPTPASAPLPSATSVISPQALESKIAVARTRLSDSEAKLEAARQQVAVDHRRQQRAPWTGFWSQ